MNIFPMLADKISREPLLLQRAHRTLVHWRQEKLAPAERLKAWDQLLRDAQQSSDGLIKLLQVLRDPSEEALQLRAFAPLAGLLTREERRAIASACTYDH